MARKLVLHEEFENFESYAESLMKRGAGRGNTEASCGYLAFNPKLESRGRDWDLGVGNIPAYRAFVAGGWSKGRKELQDTIGRLAFPKAKSVRRRTAFGEEGTEVELDRLMRGEVDVMWRTTRRESGGGQRRNIKIVVNCAAACSHSADEFFWRGAVACVVADALEDAGFRVEIDLYSYWQGMFQQTQGKIPDYFLSVTVKQYDEALDIARVAALVSHPAFLRVTSFSHVAVLDDVKPTAHRGYPIHTDPSADVRQEVFGLPDKYVEMGDIVIDGVWNQKDALALLKQIEARFS